MRQRSRTHLWIALFVMLGGLLLGLVAPSYVPRAPQAMPAAIDFTAPIPDRILIPFAISATVEERAADPDRFRHGQSVVQG